MVVGGHSHSLLSNTDPKAEGPYPTMVDNPDGYKVPVVQAASYSKYLGEIKIVFDDNGVVKEATGDPIYLDKSVTPDAAVLARIKELGAPIEALKAQEVSETTEADRRQPRQLPRPRMRDGRSGRRRDPRPRQGPGRRRSSSRTAAACALRSTRASSRWARC